MLVTPKSLAITLATLLATATLAFVYLPKSGQAEQPATEATETTEKKQEKSETKKTEPAPMPKEIPFRFLLKRAASGQIQMYLNGGPISDEKVLAEIAGRVKANRELRTSLLAEKDVPKDKVQRVVELIQSLGVKYVLLDSPEEWSKWDWQFTVRKDNPMQTRTRDVHPAARESLRNTLEALQHDPYGPMLTFDAKWNTDQSKLTITAPQAAQPWLDLLVRRVEDNESNAKASKAEPSSSVLSEVAQQLASNQPEQPTTENTEKKDSARAASTTGKPNSSGTVLTADKLDVKTPEGRVVIGGDDGKRYHEPGVADDDAWLNDPNFINPRDKQIATKAWKMLGHKLVPTVRGELTKARSVGYSGGLKDLSYHLAAPHLRDKPTILVALNDQHIRGFDDLDKALAEISRHLPSRVVLSLLVEEAAPRVVVEPKPVRDGEKTVRELIAAKVPAENARPMTPEEHAEHLKSDASGEQAHKSTSEPQIAADDPKLIRSLFQKSDTNPIETRTYDVPSNLRQRLSSEFEGWQIDPYGPQVSFDAAWTNGDKLLTIRAPKAAHDKLFEPKINRLKVLVASKRAEQPTTEGTKDKKEHRETIEANGYRATARKINVAGDGSVILQGIENLEHTAPTATEATEKTEKKPTASPSDGSDVERFIRIEKDIQETENVVVLINDEKNCFSQLEKTHGELAPLIRSFHIYNVKLDLSTQEAKRHQLTPDSVCIVFRGGKEAVRFAPVVNAEQLRRFVAGTLTANWPTGINFPTPKEAEISKRAWNLLQVKIVPATDEDLKQVASKGWRGGLKLVDFNHFPNYEEPFILKDIQSKAMSRPIALFEDVEQVLDAIIAYKGDDAHAVSLNGEAKNGHFQWNVRLTSPVTVRASTKFPSLEDQKLADLAWKRLGLELEPIAGDDLQRVKALGYDGGVKVAANDGHTVAWEGQNSIQPNDILVGLHVWPTTNLKDIATVLNRDDLAELNPLKFYVVRPGAGKNQTGAMRQPEEDSVVSGRINVQLAGDSAADRARLEQAKHVASAAVLKAANEAESLIPPLQEAKSKLRLAVAKGEDVEAARRVFDSANHEYDAARERWMAAQSRVSEIIRAINALPSKQPAPQPLPLPPSPSDSGSSTAPSPLPSATSTPASNPLAPATAAEIEVLRERVKVIEERYRAIEALHKTAARGGSTDAYEVSAYELALARGELALAEGKHDAAQKSFAEARQHAEAAFQAVNAAYQSGRITYDRVLEAARNLSDIKLRLIRLAALTSQPTKPDTSPPTVSAPSTLNQGTPNRYDAGPSTATPTPPTENSPVLHSVLINPSNPQSIPPAPRASQLAPFSSPLAPQTSLRYDGKPFEEWRNVWKTELSTQKRLEALKALEAFAAAGMEKEVNSAILDGIYSDSQATAQQIRKRLSRLNPTDAAPVVRSLQSTIKSELSSRRRIDALRALAAIGPNAAAALDDLKVVLATKEPQIRIAAATAIKRIVGKDQYQKPLADVLGNELGIEVAKTNTGEWGAVPRDANTNTDAYLKFTEDVIKEQELLFPPELPPTPPPPPH